MTWHKQIDHSQRMQGGNLAFWVYCSATVFMIFFSITAIQKWPFPYNQISISISCILPAVLVFVWKFRDWIQNKSITKESVYILIILGLGLLNILFSEDRSTTLKAMSLFLLSGIGVFWVTKHLLNTRFRQNIFLWLCTICFLVLCAYGAFEYSVSKSNIYPILLFSYNAIPAGSLLILLIIGPLQLFPNKNRGLMIFCLILGFILILLIGRRGPLLGVASMVLLFGFLAGGKLWRIILLALILIGSGYYYQCYFKKSIQQRNHSSLSTKERLEHYLYGAHVFSKKPLFGIGLRASLSPYLSDYKAKLHISSYYKIAVIQKLKTLENIVLTSLVEMGLFFSFAYFLLIYHLLTKNFRNNWNEKSHRLRATLFLLPLGGFFVHSMTFDSLMFPHLNWLFHSLLGMMANLDKFNNEASPQINTLQRSRNQK